MSGEALLSELCSTCYAEKPKYRCPRCKTQTCSLPCYKKHQQRATCNGKRDPSEYQKKSQLATPAGVDRDYNYLKGVELSIDHANRESRDRGIGTGNVGRFYSRNTHPDSKLQRYLVTNNIDVQRAPRGMSRQKANNSRTTKNGNVIWTVELIDGDGNAEKHDNWFEHRSLEDLYALAQREKRNSEKRKADPELTTGSKAAKKRPRQKCDGEPNCKPTLEDSITAQARSPESQVEKNSTEQKVEQNLKREEQPEQGTASNTNPGPSETESGAKREATPREDPAAKLDSDAEGKPQPPCFFYLLKVGTSSPSKVLIPLDAKDTLTTALRGQTVLEFPTIHVLSDPPEQLSADYTLIAQYNEIQSAEDAELTEALKKAGKDGVTQRTDGQEDRAPSAAVDANKILDMLKRDVTR